jgi:hypothetical protein
MPYTLSHPLAVVPLRRWCPARFNLAALVIGSMSPDFGYFVDLPAAYAHTIQGMFVICLPTSFLVLSLFYLLRWPVCFILPQPHRAALAPLAFKMPTLTFRGLAIAAISVLVGALTHIVWDSFTHDYGWPVQQFEILRAPLFQIQGRVVRTYDVLQILSSLVGGAGLMLLYFLWLRRQPNAAIRRSGADRWRYYLLGAVSFAALAIAAALACYHTRSLRSGVTIASVIYWTAVYSISFFFPLIALASVVVYATNRDARVQSLGQSPERE